MYNVVRLTTSLPRGEVDRIDRLEKVVDGNLVVRRARILRAMLRFVLDHEEQFLDWFSDVNGQPVEGGE